MALRQRFKAAVSQGQQQGKRSAASAAGCGNENISIQNDAHYFHIAYHFTIFRKSRLRGEQ